VRIYVAHYTSVSANRITAITINSVSATLLKRQQATNSENSAEIWEVAATSGTPVATITYGGSADHYTTLSIQEVSGSGAVRGTSVGNTATDTAPTNTTDSATQTGDEIGQAYAFADNGAPTQTPPSGYTVLFNLSAGSFEYGGAVWRIAAAGGAQAVTWGLSASGNWATALVVWAPAAGSTVDVDAGTDTPGVSDSTARDTTFSRSVPGGNLTVNFID
jgi:hypothetical protein